MLDDSRSSLESPKPEGPAHVVEHDGKRKVGSWLKKMFESTATKRYNEVVQKKTPKVSVNGKKMVQYKPYQTQAYAGYYTATGGRF